MSWAAGFIWFGLAFIVLGIFGVCLDVYRTRRRDQRAFKINPMFKVGGDIRDRS